MRRIASVYLAGPDLWFPDAAEHALNQRALCEEAGFAPFTAFDQSTVESDPSEVMAREIYADRIGRLRQADAVIANLTPWRGPHAEPGTAFEMGFASALGKPVFAYLNVTAEDEADLKGRIEAVFGAMPDEDGRPRDALGSEIEDFGLPESLMLWAEARRVFVIVTADPLGDLTGLELALQAVRVYAEA